MVPWPGCARQGYWALLWQLLLIVSQQPLLLLLLLLLLSRPLLLSEVAAVALQGWLRAPPCT
jgi:hypothetical protein